MSDRPRECPFCQSEPYQTEGLISCGCADCPVSICVFSLSQWNARTPDHAAELEAERAKVAAFKLALAEFRDAVLEERHQLEAPCLDNDQTTNAVLGLFDGTFQQFLTPTPEATYPSHKEVGR